MKKIETLITLWQNDFSIEWWKMLLIGMFLLLANFVFFWMIWFISRNTIIEVGYSKRSKKYIAKKIKAYKFIDKIFLLRIVLEAEKFNPMLIICIIGNTINFLAALTSVIGFVGCMITLADGWAFTLLLESGIIAFFITMMLYFIPSMVWVPSERRRHFGKIKK